MTQEDLKQDANPEKLLNAAVRRTEWAQKQFETRFSCLHRVLKEDLDKNERVTETEYLFYRIFPILGRSYKELVKLNGQPLTDEQNQEELRKKEAFIEVVKRGEQPASNGKEEYEFKFDEKFINRYRFRILGVESLNNRPTYVLFFEPKEGDLPVNNRMDYGLNKSVGRIWIDQEDLAVVRVEFHLAETLRFWLGLLAEIRRIDGQIDFIRLEPQVWLPSRFHLNVDARVFFKNIRQRIKMDWREYSKVPPGTADLPGQNLRAVEPGVPSLRKVSNR